MPPFRIKTFWRGTVVWCSLLAFALPCSLPAGPAPGRPNFIFILIDDMGYGDLSCYGGKTGLTPNIDSLASEGIRFTQFYVGSPICSPSRTAFTTGQCPARWGITSYLAARDENERRSMAQWLDVKAPTLARTLQRAGYVTGHFGKWHMGGQRDVGEAPLISEYGFDETLTQFEGLGDRILPLLNTFDGEPAQKYALGSDNLGRGKIEWLDRSKVTSAFVGRSLEFIQRAEKSGKPFYVNLWPDDVHSPFFPPKELRGDSSKRELYLGVTKAMDAQIAPLLDHVRQSPRLLTNTIIVIASDNGPEPGAGSAGPFRGHKGMIYEGGIREPFIVWSPGFLEKSVHGAINRTTVVSALDFFPSIARLAGATLPLQEKLDGEDLSRVWLGQSSAPRTTSLFWNRPPDRPGPAADPWPDLAMREGNWKLLLMRDGSNAQLFDLVKDPSETNNLAGQYPDIVRRMREPLLAWWRSLPVGPDVSDPTPSRAKSLSEGVSSPTAPKAAAAAKTGPTPAEKVARD